MLAKATNPKLGFVSVQSSGTNHEAARTRVQGRAGAVRPELLEEVKKKNIDDDSTNTEGPSSGKVKKNTSVDSGNEIRFRAF